ncbi:hypothetical protein F5Y19DRAFT_471446 [Xylariaceae sp. FL1651]|nr:hypothetical protein F5Y19DRAFT_471446 [Xylariaceae sp. FL1651]
MAPYTLNMSLPTAVLAVNSVGLALSFAAVSLRFYQHRHKMTVSDYTIIVAWLVTAALVVTENVTVTRGGVGQNIANVTKSELLLTEKLFVGFSFLGYFSVAFVRISILSLFLSIFWVSKTYRVIGRTLLIITVLVLVSFTITRFAACIPFASNWDKMSHPNYRCIDVAGLYDANGIISAVLDISILVTPVPFIWATQFKTGRKIAIICLFGIGVLVCAVSLVRVYVDTLKTFQKDNYTRYAAFAEILGPLEPNLAIVCACLPTYSALLRRIEDQIHAANGTRQWLLMTLTFRWSRESAQRSPQGSYKLGSSAEVAGQARPSTGEDAASARRENIATIDRLYPITVATVASATRASLDRVEPVGKPTSLDSRGTDPVESFEMTSMARR